MSKKENEEVSKMALMLNLKMKLIVEAAAQKEEESKTQKLLRMFAKSEPAEV
jgi:hypothetical protein